MNQKEKKPLSNGIVLAIGIPAGLVWSLVQFAAVIAGISGLSYIEDAYDGNEFSTWMSSVNDEAFIKDIVLPGSHDAGTEGMFYAGCTQKYSVADQLDRGVRYFDLRVNKKGNDLFIFHSILDGDPFSDVVRDLSSFMKTHPTEFVVLDFQHFKNNAYEATFDLLERNIPEDWFVQNNTPLDDLTYVDSLKIKDVRGKFLVTVGKEKNEITRPYHFVRDADSTPREHSVLQSPYETDENAKPSKKYIEESLPKYLAQRKAHPEGLFVLQGQLTDKFLVFGPGFRETGHDWNMSRYLYSLAASPDLNYINIVMRDFMDVRKSSEILALNLKKTGIIKDANMHSFATMLQSHLITWALNF